MEVSRVIGRRVANGTVKADWIDYNGHMNVAYYVLAFDLAIDELWARLGISSDYIRETSGSTFAVETHITYQRELKENDPYYVTMELLAYDAKRIHQFQRMYHANEHYLAATSEWMSLHVDLSSRRVTPWPNDVLQTLANMADAQGSGPLPADAGKQMRVPQPIYVLDEDMYS